MTADQYPEEHWKVIQAILQLTEGNSGVAVPLDDVGCQAGGKHKSRQSLWWMGFLQDIVSARKSDIVIQWVDESGTEWVTLGLPQSNSEDILADGTEASEINGSLSPSTFTTASEGPLMEKEGAFTYEEKVGIGPSKTNVRYQQLHKDQTLTIFFAIFISDSLTGNSYSMTSHYWIWGSLPYHTGILQSTSHLSTQS